jgi:hypothetical protein
MEIQDVKKQALSTLICDPIVCNRCKFIFPMRNDGRVTPGYPCPQCNEVNRIGRLYFSMNVSTLIDLIQDAYHSTPLIENELYSDYRPHDVSVLIYFCTLREVLLGNLVCELLTAENVSDGLQERLLTDNKFHVQKQDKLFYSLTGDKWQEAIKKAAEVDSADYLEVDKFVKDIANKRNLFIHEGNSWSIDRDLVTNCIKRLRQLLHLYVTLHNLYVHSRYKDSKTVVNQ